MTTKVGKWFHSTENGEIIRQGKILKRLENGNFLVQLYSWAIGDPSDQEIVRSNEMTNWIFYDSNADMVTAGDAYLRKQRL